MIRFLKNGKRRIALIFTYLDRLLKSDCVLSAKAYASPFEHLGLLGKVRDIEGSILRKQCLVSITDQVIDFVK